MPDGFMIEHYSDGQCTFILSCSIASLFLFSLGDQVNCHNDTSYLPASDEALAIWGPAVRKSRHLFVRNIGS
jgi:hypothetical protein